VEAGQIIKSRLHTCHIQRRPPDSRGRAFKTFPGQGAGLAYVCTELFAAALQQAKSSSPDAIRSALASTTFDSGPASLDPPGKIQFNSAGVDAAGGNVTVQWCKNFPYAIAPKGFAVQAAKPSAQCQA
jgi:ABC-type branched-subunit amino acid transport system substrate-binding protein